MSLRSSSATFMDLIHPPVNESWAAPKMPAQNGSIANAMGQKLEGLFDGRQLPMYKDKPYSYAASRRKPSLYKRPQILVGLLLSILGLFYCLQPYMSVTGKSRRVIEPGKIDLSRLRPGLAAVNWEDRREKVKEAFVLSWDGYEQNAWGESLLCLYWCFTLCCIFA